jgi:tetratricopeptide (TPR) repeat protein
MTVPVSHFFHLSPTSPARTRLEEAERFFLTGNLNEALAAAQQAWREHPDDPDIFRVLAYVHMTLGEYPPAGQAAFRAVELDRENPASYATLAQVYLTFNMLSLAEETLAAALPQFPNDPTLLTLSADVRFRRGQEGRAVEQVTLALQQNPNDGYAKALLGAHHLRRKHYTAAVTLLTDAVAAYPQRWDFLRDLGIALVHTGNYPAAQARLAQSFRLNPLDARAKQYLFLAARLGQTRGSGYWTMAFFFYRNAGWGWFLNIVGLLGLVVGGIWSIVLATDWHEHTLDETLVPGGLLLGGLLLCVITHAGLALYHRRGRRFDALLSRETAALEGAPPGS